MDSIVLKGNRYSGNTIVSNCFIDEYMADANGAQLKIYLYLMRCIEADEPVTVSLLADRFNYTETDIIRSLLYWARKGIISIEFDEDRDVSGIVLNDPSEAEETEVSLPKKPSSQASDKKHRSYAASELSDFGNKAEIKQLVFVAEQYLGRTLNPADMKTLLFLYDELGFTEDLIEYLIEYCVDKKKTSMRYIEQTAMNWAEAGVKDVAGAKAEVRGFNGGDYFTVLRAYGISNRNPVDFEIEYVDKWQKEYGFPMKIILEAVSRTMKAIANPSFPYTDKILKGWYESGAQSLEDVEKRDAGFKLMTASSLVNKSTGQFMAQTGKKEKKNKFHNFPERKYDFAELEKQLLRK